MFCRHKFEYYSGDGGSDFYRVCTKCHKAWQREVTYEGYTVFHRVTAMYMVVRLSNDPKLRKVVSSLPELHTKEVK